MNETVENKQQSTKMLGGITGKGFMPGQSGNPGGRPRNPLKDFSLAEFKSWTDAQKKAFLKKVSPLDRWKMTEGNPSNDLDVKGDIVSKIISVDE